MLGKFIKRLDDIADKRISAVNTQSLIIASLPVAHIEEPVNDVTRLVQLHRSPSPRIAGAGARN
jgi:hypothetical protein